MSPLEGKEGQTEGGAGGGANFNSRLWVELREALKAARPWDGGGANVIGG